MKKLQKMDTHHLGILVGNPDANRIIAVSTAAVFDDKSLPHTFWGMDNRNIDSGFQGHLYTGPDDILVVRVPGHDPAIIGMVSTAIKENCEIWKSLTGIDILPATGNLILASDYPCPSVSRLPEQFTWHVGSLLDAAVARFRKGEEAFLAFVPDNQLAKALGISHDDNPGLVELAQNTSLLMDKNAAMQVLQAHGVNCAATYPVNEDSDPATVIGKIPASGHFVFKPSGGAAGIGVFGNTKEGVSLDAIREHLDTLRHLGQLPGRYQIQEFLPGKSFGATAFLYQDGTFDLFEIHQQIINHAGRFIGGRWTPAIQAAQFKSTNTLFTQMTAISQPRISGLICLDVIKKKIIEVNPRLTASAPITHILRRQGDISRHLGSQFSIKQIDLNTAVQIPFAAIQNGNLRGVIERMWNEYQVLVLPQGINPFGASRFVFINDSVDGKAQLAFIRQTWH